MPRSPAGESGIGEGQGTRRARAQRAQAKPSPRARPEHAGAWATRQHDDDLGLIDMRGRVYDPLAGRFMTADPIMQAPFSTQGLNRYSYVFNDPINATDPSGFLGISPGYPAGAVVTGGWGDVAGLGAGTALQVGTTLINGLPQSTAGGTYAVAPASQAPTTASATPTTQHAVGQKGAPGAAKDPLADREAYAGKLYSIARALQERRIELAVQTTRMLWQIPESIPVNYVEDLADENGNPLYGLTEFWPEGKQTGRDVGRVEISVGKLATNSATVLVSTLAHEGGPPGSHLSQAPYNWARPGARWARAVNELEAYRLEESLAGHIGLSDKELMVVKDNIRLHEKEIQGTEYAARVAKGNYRLRKEDVWIVE